MSTLEKMHKECIQAVYDSDYYVTKFKKLCEDRDPHAMTDELEICSFWHNFWYDLPDHPSIRRYPFFKICDLAEGEYLNDE